MDDLQNYQHRRYNPLTDEWILVSPHRTKRPWLGDTLAPKPKETVPYDARCYLCPGNVRANGVQNPRYQQPFAFENDFAALQRDIPPQLNIASDPLLRAQREYGLCKVLCYAPQHNIHFPDMEEAHIVDIINLWETEFIDIAKNRHINHIQIFENRGKAMGASNPHPHGQIWANESIPHIALRKAQQQLSYQQSHTTKLLGDYLAKEKEERARIIVTMEHFTWLVPFWALWPYETMIIAHRPVALIHELQQAEKAELARMLQRVVATYDLLFDTPFPYSMGIHLPPPADRYQAGWQFHIGFYPPLLRSASVRKFMVGYELCAMPQRDITPEYAAKTLRAL